MTLPLYPDGCIIPNIQTKHYLVYFAPKCEHTKLRGAYIGIDAPSADDALIYASESIRLAHLTPVSVAEYHDYLDFYDRTARTADTWNDRDDADRRANGEDDSDPGDDPDAA